MLSAAIHIVVTRHHTPAQLVPGVYNCVGLRDNHRIAHHRLEGVYLPCYKAEYKSNEKERQVLVSVQEMRELR